MNPYDDDAPTNVQGTPPPSSDQSAKSDQKSAITAAIVGTAALGGAAYAMSQFLNDDSIGDNNDGGNNENQPPPPPKDTIPPPPPPDNHDQLANIDTTPKTFEEAFAEARTAYAADHDGKGGGGYFEFDRDGDGKTEYYSTYIDSEWENLSHHEKQDFYARVPDYQPPTSGGGGGVSGAVHADTGIAHNSNVPAPVDDVEIIDEDDNNVVVEADPDNTHVAQVADGSTGRDADVIQITDNEGDIYILDADHDDKADIMMRPDTHDALIDTDHDGRMDAHVEYDREYNVTHAESLRDPLPTVSMQSLHDEQAQESESDTLLASDSELDSDYDNNADISDFDYTA